MDTPRNFRSAFHGFNREDVAHYLEYINAKHASQVNQLTAEAEELRSRPDVSPDEQSHLQLLKTQCELLTAQLEEAQAENAQLRARCEALEAQHAPESRELDIYRRAEKTEREARDRAELTYFQANGVLTEATVKVESAAAEITEKADTLMGQITQLQVAVSGSKQALQDAAAMMKAIRP